MTIQTPISIGEGRNDAMGLALLTLAQELWVLKDRQLVTEALLHEKGLLAEVDSYQPNPELSERLAKERQRFIGAITTILLTGKPAET